MNVLSLKQYLALRGNFFNQQQTQERCFSCSRLAYQRHELSLFHLKGNILKRVGIGRIVLGDVLETDHGCYSKEISASMNWSRFPSSTLSAFLVSCSVRWSFTS